MSPIPTSEYDAVVKTAQTYIDGLAAGDNDILRKAFHKDATMYGFTADNNLLGGPIENLYGYVDAVGKAPDIKTHVDVLGITPTTAVVKVEMENASGFNFTDFHTLLKVDNKWSIIGKIFHTNPSSVDAKL